MIYGILYILKDHQVQERWIWINDSLPCTFFEYPKACYLVVKEKKQT